MAASTPFEQLTGTLQVYIAPYGEALPAVNVTPAGNWFLLGPTDGEQKMTHGGALEMFYDNDHQAPVKAVRPEEQLTVTFTLVGMTLEKWARVMSSVNSLVSAGGPPAIRTMPFKRGVIPTEYALLLRGTAMSPYGAFPGYYYFPRGVFDGEPETTWAKNSRVALECEFVVLEDDNQSDGNRMGFLRVQTA